MINRSQRVILMKKLSNYYQTEKVSSEKKKELSASLLDDNDIRLHKLIMELEPVTDIGKLMLDEIFKAIQIG
ncbi:hypothetical protein [Ruminococcus albus]|uniref:Uncharacterized protein n=1 Tax=Ruminococcus albus (strain ATCC 27210 / DSM 20455 / JCM 14654 / NCDO 2250 / 7) TaxID=697329 RepID=E6UJC2_RUMA7|nr:hypothetical protein [Ruminococcus albus]ADU23768.1 hypothetical protein Rumal_3305 [Ruminococcus albus 7 = DSM 20455]